MDFVSVFMAVRSHSAVKDHFDESLCYAGFLVVLGFAARFLSDMKFSAVITLGAAVQCLGFCLLRLKMRKQQGVQGISSRTLQMFFLMYLFRLYSTLQYNGYLPVDRTGDWAYQAIDVCAACIVLSLLVTIHGKYEATYEKEYDTCAIHWFLAGCLCLAVLVHPHLNGWAPLDIPWAAGLYLETLAMLPQLWMVQKSGGCQAFTAHFIFATLMSRAFSAAFWLYGAENIARQDDESSFGSILYSLPALAIVLAHVLQFLFLADFGFFYMKATLRGGLQSFSGSLTIQEV